MAKLDPNSKDAYIKKVLTLLNIAEVSSSEHESESARAFANKLKEKWAITQEDLNKSEFLVKEFTLKYNACPYWYKNIWYEVSNLLGCYAVYIKTGSGAKAKFRVSGPEDELLHLEYLSEALCNQINQLSYKYFYDKPDMSRADRMPYRNGLSERAVERLEMIISGAYQLDESGGFEDNLMMDQDQALVLIQDKVEKAKSRYLEKHCKPTTSSVYIRRDGDGYDDGYNDGKRLGLNKAMGGGGKLSKQLGR